MSDEKNGCRAATPLPAGQGPALPDASRRTVPQGYGPQADRTPRPGTGAGPDGGIVIRLQRDPDPQRLRLLGDTLVRALAGEAGSIVVWIRGMWRPSPEAANLFNSLGRCMAREGRRHGIRLRGDGPAYDALVAAYRQGRRPPRAARTA